MPKLANKFCQWADKSIAALAAKQEAVIHLNASLLDAWKGLAKAEGDSGKAEGGSAEGGRRLSAPQPAPQQQQQQQQQKPPVQAPPPRQQQQQAAAPRQSQVGVVAPPMPLGAVREHSAEAQQKQAQQAQQQVKAEAEKQEEEKFAFESTGEAGCWVAGVGGSGGRWRYCMRSGGVDGTTACVQGGAMVQLHAPACLCLQRAYVSQLPQGSTPAPLSLKLVLPIPCKCSRQVARNAAVPVPACRPPLAHL